MEEFRMYYENWRIIYDYILWVEAGGKEYYGSVGRAREWATALLLAQNECLLGVAS